jgi:hypothetical protein
MESALSVRLTIRTTATLLAIDTNGIALMRRMPMQARTVPRALLQITT